MAVASLVLVLALGAGVCALSGLVLAIVGVSRRRRVLLRSGVVLAACGALGFVVAGTLTLSRAVGQVGAISPAATPTVFEQRQWFRIATGSTLPAGSDPIGGTQQRFGTLPTYYLVIGLSPAFERMLAREFIPTDDGSGQRAFTPPPDLQAWRLMDSPDVRYYTRTYELPSRAVFVSYVAVDPASQAAYFVGVQVSD